MFRPRLTKSREGKYGINFSPVVSEETAKAIRSTVRSWQFHQNTDKSLTDLSRVFNPVLCVDELLRQFARRRYWTMKKFMTFRGKIRQAPHWLGHIAHREPQLFAIGSWIGDRRLVDKSWMNPGVDIRIRRLAP